ncbi:hypothetical protein ScPMuIL_002035 [Solemya velum]
MDVRGQRRSEGGSDDERTSLSSSIAGGTSRFFNSVLAKKNGLFSDLSNKFESVGTFMKNSPSDSGRSRSSSTSSGGDSPTANRHPPIGKLKGKSRKDRENAANKYSSSSTSYDSAPRYSSQVTSTDSAPMYGSQQTGSSSGYSDSSAEDRSPVPNVNMSFDEPLYSPTRKTFSSVNKIEADRKCSDSRNGDPSGGGQDGSNSSKLCNGGSDNGESGDNCERKRAPKFTTTKRRSSTVDEMLFDDYVEPEAPEELSEEARKKVGSDLINFEEDQTERKKTLITAVKTSPFHSISSMDSSDYSGQSFNQTSMDSSDGEFGGTVPFHRSGSMGSDNSWSSTYSIDSQPDDLTLECMEFMKKFVEKIFSVSENIAQVEKAQFGKLCQYSPGRLWFARYVNSQRVHSKKVDEQIFFRLVQYFAVVLFECNEAEDFSPAKSLMNMCFTFYHETILGSNAFKNFLYSYLREQPIWQSIRFWNAAFFDAVQCERSRRPMTTREDGNADQRDDRRFQENITFGQLGTFSCNMRSFGLQKELCLEFLRKQATIANLREEQIQMLRDNVEKWKDH